MLSAAISASPGLTPALLSSQSVAASLEEPSPLSLQSRSVESTVSAVFVLR